MNMVEESKHGRCKRPHESARQRISTDTVVYGPEAPDSVITLTALREHELVEKPIADLNEIKDALQRYPVNWIHIKGLADAEMITNLGQLFNIHNLVLEDVMSCHQRAKVEEWRGQYFIVCQMLKLVGERLDSDQLNIFLGKNFIVTFHDGQIDCLESARERIRKRLSSAGTLGCDYVAYLLLDAVLDGYFPILETFGETLEAIEDDIIQNPSKECVARLHIAKRNLITLRRTAWPLREAINSLIRDQPPLFESETLIHMRDCSDHAVQILDFVETDRELASDLMDVYLSSISNRLNEVMMVLTIITTVFVPPTLVAGIYGMNFKSDLSPYNMPELSWYYGYPIALAFMLCLAVATVIFMGWKGWLGTFWHRQPR